MEKEYGNKVRFTWKNYPLPFHNNAEPAAEARHGGGRPGQVLGDARQAVRQPAAARSSALEKYAQELGLNMAKFKATSTLEVQGDDRVGDQGGLGQSA
jgi:hypothetical protein